MSLSASNQHRNNLFAEDAFELMSYIILMYQEKESPLHVVLVLQCVTNEMKYCMLP